MVVVGLSLTLGVAMMLVGGVGDLEKGDGASTLPEAWCVQVGSTA